MFQLDKQKYLDILKAQGLDAAVTALHHDKERYEIETFEGRKGYQPEMFDDLKQFREFSIELWNELLREPKKA